METLASRGAAIRAGPVQNRRNSRSDRPDGLFVRRSDDKFVVPFARRNPLLCNMKRQRRNDILVEQVVERLKSIRRAQGLTQENVRFDTDLNIGRIESGRHSISLTTLADLCDYYGISLEDFFKEIVTRK